MIPNSLAWGRYMPPGEAIVVIGTHIFSKFGGQKKFANSKKNVQINNCMPPRSRF